MRTSRLITWAALAAVAAALAAPAPASAQIGRFIKKKLQEKVAKAVVESVVPADTPVTPAPASAQPAAPGEAAKAAPGRAVKGQEAAPAPAAGLTFNEWVLELNPAMLDKLQQGLVAEAATVQENARILARMRDTVAYRKCSQQVTATPEGQKMMALLDKGDMRGYQAAWVEVAKIQEAKCGPEPSHYNTVKDGLASRRWEAVEKATHFTYRQYDILKERALPFCSLPAASAGGDVKIPIREGVFLVYSPAEVEALRARCGTLLPMLKATV